jgi:hypothetical protein
MRLVTIDEASAHLRRDTDDDNGDLLLKIEAASEMVMDYIGEQDWTDSAGEPYEDTAGNGVDVPHRVRAATLMLIGYLYRERDASMEHAVPTQWGFGFLPLGVTALLYPLRKPTVA